MVIQSPNQPPRLVALKDLSNHDLKYKVLYAGTNRLIQLKAEVESLILDLEAARAEATRRGWVITQHEEPGVET